ncbi:MAG TPA: restriction endonuclease [Polyangiaceae bacterium]|nr:restriction endonuclease [Polyangiaceae bacterium]
MITNRTPSDWRDLQEQVAAILRECGFAAEVEKTLATVRGNTAVDVYAEETVKGRKYVILCECKHWANPVPQQTIHAFRTTVADVGANVGYVISSSGFQSGAFAASELTNVELVTWEEFQAKFEESWLEYFSSSLTERLDPLLTYTEPLLPKWFGDLPEDEKRAFLALKERHDPMGHLVASLATHMRIFNKSPFPTLPLRSHYAAHPDFLAVLPGELLDISGYRELRSELVRLGDAAIAEFRAIRARRGATTTTDESHE